MIVRIDKSLEKDVKKITEHTIKRALAKIILEIQEAKTLSEINAVKKLKGTKNCFRIRIGDYRLGIIVNGNEVELIRILHRKEIYRFFP